MKIKFKINFYNYILSQSFHGEIFFPRNLRMSIIDQLVQNGVNIE